MPSRSSTSADDFLLPDLGEGLEEAELIEWCVHVGQTVAENDILAKMETAKALVEVPSPRAGTIAILHGKPGQAIKVGSPLVTYHQPNGRDGNGAATPAATTPTPPAPIETPAASIEESADAGTVVGTLTPISKPHDGKAQAAPAVRRLARDLGVDIDQVAGSGIGGRVTTADVQAASHAVEAPTEPAPAPAAASVSEVDADRIPLRGVRRTIAQRLRYSVDHAVHFTVMDEADVSALEELRRRLMTASNEKITLLPFVASAACRVLGGAVGSQFARLNSTVDDERQEILQHRTVHLGIAADTDSGLLVPVIRNAGSMGVMELGRQITRVARAARERALPPGALMGSTFTISNFGSLGGRWATPIINYPEAAILAVGRAHDGVVVRHGMLGVGRLLPLSLSADHRVIDGATAAAALAKIIQLLQTPQELLPPG